jgi:FkbM family methyltransferase
MKKNHDDILKDLVENSIDYFGEMRRFAEEYSKYFNEPPKNVLEIGSRDGYHADYLKKYFNIPDDKVFIVDAHPYCANLIRIDHPNYRVIEAAIAPKRGILKFNAIQNLDLGSLGMSSLLPKVAGPDFGETWVNVIAITGEDLIDLIEEPEIDLLKLDVEGLTYEVLESFSLNLRRVKFIHTEAEYFEVWKGQKLYQDLCDLLTKYGFKEAYCVQTIKEQQCDTVWYRA